MSRRNTLVFLIVIIVFILSLLVVLPVDEGAIGKKGIRLGLDLQGGMHIVYKADLSSIEAGGESEAMKGAIAVIENRVNPLGVTEPVVQIQGDDRIIVELPGISITDEEKERLARVDILEFGELTTDNESGKWESQYYNQNTGRWEDGTWKPATAITNGEEKALTSRYFKTNTQVGQDNYGKIELHFEWDEEGSELFQDITTRLLKQPLAIFDGDDPLRGEDGRPIAPIIQSVLTDRGIITGLNLNEAIKLSRQLNFGRLPVPLEIIYDQTISPILGSDFVGMSVKAGFIGVIIIMLFMILYYRFSGFVASLALIFYGVLVLAVFKLWPGGGITLTLAGIGGFILSIGMAVDANVLIFERVKEEVRAGRTLGAAIEAGFNRAWTAIRDSNVTTLIVCGILLWLGSHIVASAPVVAFAWALAIGVVISMFTAIVVTRTLLRLFVRTGLGKQAWLFTPRTGRK